MKPKTFAPPTSQAIRQSFLDFFAQRGHTIVPSSSLVPGGDETLLFTNAGMVQFKDVFLGTGSRPYTRAADSQKCMRVAGKHNDLDDVGRDDTHHTFFEMLGNWSFGDYYKAEAITWAWELLTEVWGLPRQHLWATCFADEKNEIPRDEEAAELWRQQPGFHPDHVLYFGRKENFWEMADVGPCGPDTEIHLDRGEDACDKRDVAGHSCRVNGDCQRFLELWNLVFIQYNRTGPSSLEPLPHKHVDTGMGFERLVSVLQGVRSNYETDLFVPLLRTVQGLLQHDDRQAREHQVAYRVIADHARAASFLIADGVVPGNTGRNYVCRMVIRRAARFGAEAGFHAPFLAEVARTVVDVYGSAYPELVRHQRAIERTLTDEEERFQRTVDTGLNRLDLLLAEAASSGGILDGTKAFDLYATYGLPLEISRDVARERDLSVDEGGFREAMAHHREASTGTAAGAAVTDQTPFYRGVIDSLTQSGRLSPSGVAYEPYGDLDLPAQVLALIHAGRQVEALEPGAEGAVVLDRTPFYVASGGQVADTGTLVSVGAENWRFEVGDIDEPVAGLIVHLGRVTGGTLRVGQSCRAQVDQARRRDIMRNHTATHLLHAGLRSVLGEHARQAGSLVAPDRLRFDFTHSRAMQPDELARVQRFVTSAVLEDYALEIREKPRAVAEAEGAMALFGETYGASVRTISIGRDERLSYELCGGTHVRTTGDIGPFMIVREESVAAGIRRIEALTGREAQAHFERATASLERVAAGLGTSSDRVEAQLDALMREHRDLTARVAALERQAAGTQLATLPIEEIGSVAVLLGTVAGCDADTLRALSDPFRREHTSHIVLLGSAPDGKPVLIASVSQDLAGRGISAVELVRAAAAAVGGGGGGKPTMAQAGGKNPADLPEAIDRARVWIQEHRAQIAA